MNGAGGYGAIAGVAGGVIQAIAANQEAKAMYHEFANELARQGRYRNQAFSSFDQWLPSLGAGTAQQQMQQGQQHRQDVYGQLYQDPLAITPYPGLPTDQSYYDITGQNRARLGSYGDWRQQQNIAATREGQDLAKISDFSRGDASVFPLREQDAQHSMDWLSFIGQLVSSLGGASGQYQQLFGAGQPTQQPVVYGATPG